MNNIKTIKQQIEETIRVKSLILNDKFLLEKIEHVSELITAAYNKGNKTLLAGNGGSAADAQHLSGEFVSRFYFDRWACINCSNY